METTINTFCKFKEYKEKRVGEFIQKYNAFCGVPWKWMGGMCILLFLLVLIVQWWRDGKIVSFSLDYLVILIFISAFAFWVRYKYKCSLFVQNVVYDCLKHLSCYESTICSKIELDILRKQMQNNNREMKRLSCLIYNLDLKCETINRQIRINYCKSFISTIFSMSLDEYKKMIKDKIVLLQEKCSYRQSQHKYEMDIQLLQEENKILEEKIHKIEKNIVDDEKNIVDDEKNIVDDEKNIVDDEKNIVDDEKNIVDDEKNIVDDEKNSKDTDKEKILKNIDNVLTSLSQNQKGEIRILFTDLVEVVSQIKQ